MTRKKLAIWFAVLWAVSSFDALPDAPVLDLSSTRSSSVAEAGGISLTNPSSGSCDRVVGETLRVILSPQMEFSLALATRCIWGKPLHENIENIVLTSIVFGYEEAKSNIQDVCRGLALDCGPLLDWHADSRGVSEWIVASNGELPHREISVRTEGRTTRSMTMKVRIFWEMMSHTRNRSTDAVLADPDQGPAELPMSVPMLGEYLTKRQAALFRWRKLRKALRENSGKEPQIPIGKAVRVSAVVEDTQNPMAVRILKTDLTGIVRLTAADLETLTPAEPGVTLVSVYGYLDLLDLDAKKAFITSILIELEN